MKSVIKFVVVAVLAFAALASCSWAQAAPDATAAFVPFEQWKSVVLSGDAAQFDGSLDKGVPVLAVAESDGKVVVSQKDGEFEDARRLTPEVLLEFLNKWKPQAR